MYIWSKSFIFKKKNYNEVIRNYDKGKDYCLPYFYVYFRNNI